MKKLILLCCCFIAGCQTSEKSKISSEEVQAFQIRIINHKNFNWEKLETENFMIYVPKNSKQVSEIQQIGERAEEAREKVLNLLEELEIDEKPALFYLDTRDQMRELVGHPAGGWTETRQNTVFVVQNKEVSAPLKHELGHLYSWRTWGKPMGYWLSEGLAVYAAGNCSGLSLHTWAAAIDLKQESKPIKDLEENWDFAKAAPHLQAGSFVKYVVEKYGIKAFIKIWKKGMGVSLEATGKTAEALEKEWQESIRSPEFINEAKEADPDFSGKVQCE